MRTISAAELSRLAGSRGARVSMAEQPSPAPTPPADSGQLADAILQLKDVLAVVMRQPAREAEPPTAAALPPAEVAPAPAVDTQGWSMGLLPQTAMQPVEAPLVERFTVESDGDGLLLRVSAGGATYEITRDEDGSGERIVRRAAGSVTSYRIERGRGGRITGASRVN